MAETRISEQLITMEKLSVIIVTYKRLDYLKLTIKSILDQSINYDLEVIVVGDGHQQDVSDHLSAVKDPRLQYFFVEHCGYPAKGRNLGISKAKGNIIAFCDDDDLWLPGKLEKQLRVLETYKDIILCCTNRNSIDSVGNYIAKYDLKYKPARATKTNLLFYNYVTYSTVIARREAVLRAGGFIDDPAYRAVEDYHLWLKMAALGDIYFLNQPLVSYRVHQNNISKSLSEGTRKVIKVYGDIFSSFHYPALSKLIAYSLAYTKLVIYKCI